MPWEGGGSAQRVGQRVYHVVDLVLGRDERRGEAKGLAVGVLGEYATGDEALADCAATPLLCRDVDASPQAHAAYGQDAVAHEFLETSVQHLAEPTGARLVLPRLQQPDHGVPDGRPQRVPAERRAMFPRLDDTDDIVAANHGRDR